MSVSKVRRLFSESFVKKLSWVGNGQETSDVTSLDRNEMERS